MGFNIDRTINDYISQADWRVKENSQTNYSFSGLQGHISNSALVEYALENMYTGEIARAHEDALFHIHDISHPLVGYCFTGDTLVNLWGDHGSYIPVTIKELAENETYCTKGFLVASINFEGKVCPGYARFPRITRKQAEIVEISLTNGKKIRCTPDHQFMLSDMSYKEAQDLTIDDKLMTGSEDIILVNGRSVLPYTEDVYDFTVEGYHNFMLSSGVFVHNCAGWSMEDLLRKGFSCGPNYIYSNPAKHLDALYGQVNNFIFTLTGEWAGAQALNSFDTYSAGFIKKDHMTESQVYRVLRRLIFDLNVKTRIAMQSPFSNISVDLTVPEDLKYKPVIIGGKDQDFTYGECQAEMDLFNHVLAKVMMEGDGMHKIFTFPIITYGITPDFPWDSKLAEDIFTFADEANSPYFSNFINSDQAPSDIRSMCCRLRLNLRELIKVGGGLFGSGDKTGSIGVVTLNLSKIAYISKVYTDDCRLDNDYRRADQILSNYPALRSRLRVLVSTSSDTSLEIGKRAFFIMIKYFMDLARQSLMIKRDRVQDSLDRGLIPYTKKYLGSFRNHFNTIGVNAGHEACLNLLGKGIDSEEGQSFMKDTLKYMLKVLADYQEEDNGQLLWNLEAVPAEGASTRFAKRDKKDFEHIITGAGTGGTFYTNSTQLPDNYTDNIFEVFKHQNELQPLYTSGTVQHIYMNEPTHNWRVIQSLVQTLFTNYKLPYLSISPDICVCSIHGKLPRTYKYCPYYHSEEDIKKLLEEGVISEDDIVEID